MSTEIDDVIEGDIKGAVNPWTSPNNTRAINKVSVKYDFFSFLERVETALETLPPDSPTYEECRRAYTTLT